MDGVVSSIEEPLKKLDAGEVAQLNELFEKMLTRWIEAGHS
jgi:hypothetical protein